MSTTVGLTDRRTVGRTAAQAAASVNEQVININESESVASDAVTVLSWQIASRWTERIYRQRQT